MKKQLIAQASLISALLLFGSAALGGANNPNPYAPCFDGSDISSNDASNSAVYNATYYTLPADIIHNLTSYTPPADIPIAYLVQAICRTSEHTPKPTINNGQPTYVFDCKMFRPAVLYYFVKISCIPGQGWGTPELYSGPSVTYPY